MHKTDLGDPTLELPEAKLGIGFAMLDGVRILDLTTSIAGPYATMLLGDMGAEVIKIERPGNGDDTRAWGPPFRDGQSLWFLSVNRNKRSVTLDMRSEEGQRLLGALVSRCDVAVTNQVPRVQEKLGTTYKALSRHRPDLVYASLTGFGMTGDRRDLPCYDLVAEGYSGVMDMTGELEGDPQKVGTPAADLLAGMDLAYAVTAGLFRRERTGQGCCVDISLVDSMTRFMTPQLVSYLGSGRLPRRSGARDSVIAIYQVFHASDGPMTLGLGNDAIWQRFWTAIGQPDVAQEARYASNAKRREARVELVARIQSILEQHPRAYWLELFRRHNVPAGPINRLDEVSCDDGLRERGLFYRIEDADGSAIPQVNTGFHIDGAPNAPRHQPPRLGQDTVEVLANILELDPVEVARLQSAGIV